MAYYQNQSQSPKTVLKTLPIVYLALLAGQVLFCFVAFFTQKQTPHFDVSNTSDPFLFVVPVMAVVSFVIGNVLFKQLLGQATSKTTVQQKITVYQTATIIRSAMLEGASLFGIVTYLISGNLLFITISGVIILYFILLRPTKDKIIADLNLDHQEKAELDGDTTFVK